MPIDCLCYDQHYEVYVWPRRSCTNGRRGVCHISEYLTFFCLEKTLKSHFGSKQLHLAAPSAGKFAYIFQGNKRSKWVLFCRQCSTSRITFLASCGINWPAVVHGGFPVIRGLECTEDYIPEQISAMIMGSLKTDVELRVGKPVHGALITVPAALNESQRMATEQTGMIAGFIKDVLGKTFVRGVYS